MMPLNPSMPADPYMNPLQPSFEQMTFMYTFYPEYAAAPVDMIAYLYSMAQFQEQQVMNMKNALDGDNNPYKKAPMNNRSKVKGKGKRDDDDEDFDEDVQYMNMRDMRKKKPMPNAEK